jgi:hypothetical protein
MEIRSEIMLRVNGSVVSEVALRHPAIDGHIYSDKYEVEIIDPVLGRFALTDEFVIEVKDMKSVKTWRAVPLSELITLLSPR